MKKIFLLITGLLVFCFMLSAQANVTVPVTDQIYEFLDTAQKKGLCAPLNSYKPYTRSQIFNALCEVNENSSKMTEREIKIVEEYLKLYEPLQEHSKNNLLKAGIYSHNEKFPASFNYKSEFEFIYSGGLYSKADYASWGMDNLYKLSFDGDIGKALSYKLKVVADISKMPLNEIGNYFIGYPWYEEDIKKYYSGDYKDDEITQQDIESKYGRKIRRYLNNSYLPYSYKKPWSGQFYYFKKMDAGGLEGWATNVGLGFTIDGEIRTSFFDNNIILGAGRYDREIAGMDDGSSLVLNKKAYPFLAMDVQFKIFKYLKFYSLTGILEYPNQDYINAESFKKLNTVSYIDESYFFQNAFSLNMIEIDYKRIHFDFGSSAVWPKRFELGYIFPLANYVEYQNHIGDCDNLALFTDLKYTLPGIGSIWGSIYLDELNGLNNNPFICTRAMFAYQGGIKYILPKLSFASLSFRYTKIEPYCYTHQSINYTPWYNHYICENYTNNGESLGYYLPPNSDEFLLQFKMQPAVNTYIGISYQLIRHGADYGNQQVPGSNIYSELNPYNREELRKFFLHDGAYNWMHILSAGGRFTVNTKFPLSFYGNIGFIFSYFTMINSDNYNRSVYGNNGNCKNANFSTPYYIANTDEYPTTFGTVLTIGISINY